MLLQFGKTAALTMVKGAINVDHEMDVTEGFNRRLLADSHSLDVQRYYNILCLGYGSPSGDSFKELADKYLPSGRKPNCVNEYNHASLAFTETIMPYVDKDLMKNVQTMQIFTPNDEKL
jgi:hypothetical protein